MNDKLLRGDRINKVQEAWANAVSAERLTNEEALNCAGHFLANVLMAAATTEAFAHELMNKITESNHDYINASWPAMKSKRDQFEQDIAKGRAIREA